MNFKDYLKIGMITTALSLGINTQNANALEQIVNQKTQTQQARENKNNNKQLSTAELIKAATLEDSIKFTDECKDNTPFKQQISKNGIKATYEHVAKMKSYSINLAEKYLQEPNTIPEKEYISISKQIGQDDLNFYKGYTNPLDKEVIKKRAKTLKIATENHKKLLLKTNNKYENKNISKNKNISEIYANLIKETFTEKEYTQYCAKISDSMDEYYEALANTLGWKIVIGRKDIDKMKKASREHYFSLRDKIYSRRQQNEKLSY